MKKVYQTIVDNTRGDCARAVVASLFEYDICDIPNFIETHHIRNMHQQIFDFYEARGYNPCFVHKRNKDTNELINVAKYDKGINGYFYASVPSQTFEGVSHAVVVDSDLNIVHDPNPNGKALLLTPDAVNSILTVTDFVITENGIISGKDWRESLNYESK